MSRLGGGADEKLMCNCYISYLNVPEHEVTKYQAISNWWATYNVLTKLR